MSENINQIILNGRLIHKHDIEENWKKATNFAPRLGEIIVYDPDQTHPYPRYKIGIWDGTSTKTSDMLITNLPFASLREVDGTYIVEEIDSTTKTRTLKHKAYDTKEAKIVAVGRDSGGHVVLGDEITVAPGGGGVHNHTTETTIAANTYVTGITPTTKKLSINPTKTSVVTEVPGSFTKLATTAITPVSGSVKASKATAEATVNVATVGAAVRYGTANVGEAVTVATPAVASSTFLTSINAAAPATTINTNKEVYTAEIQDETLIFSPAVISATTAAPELSITTDSITGIGESVVITPAIAAPTSQTIIPAVANGTITPYSFSDVDVPVAASPVTVATGDTSLVGSGAEILVGLGEILTTQAFTAATLTKNSTTGDVDVLESISVAKNTQVTFEGSTSDHTEATHDHSLTTE